MFDIATRPNPSPAGSTAVGVPFDWTLAPPAAARAYPWTYWSAPDGMVQVYTEPLATYALALEDTLQTAVQISLFTDARSGANDALPRGVSDRRGWVGSSFLPRDLQGRVDEWGSLLWLLYYRKATDDVPARAAFYAREALAWMVRDGIASRVDATASWVGNDGGERLAVRPVIYQPDQAAPVYDVLWGVSLRKAAA